MQAEIGLAEGRYDGDRFGVAATSLFGHIHQRFFATRERHFPSLDYMPMGHCGLTRIAAPSHAVAAPKASRRTDDPDCIKVLVQVRGATQFQTGANRIRIVPGVAVIYDPTRGYNLVNATPVEQLILQVPRSEFGARRLGFLHRPLLLADEASGPSQALTAFMQAACENGARFTQDMRVNVGLSLSSFARGLVPDRGAMNDRSGQRTSLSLLRERVLALLSRDLGDPHISIESIAARMGCSVRYLHQAFEGEGITLQKRLWRMRLDRSRALLAATPATAGSISDVALRCGFSSSSHFSRLFRQTFGVTPRQARRAAPEAIEQLLPG